MKTLIIAFFALSSNLLIAQQWFDISVPTTYKLNDIDFPTSTTGYIVGDSTIILKSIDGGESWVELSPIGLSNSAFSDRIVDVDFVNDQVGFITILNDNSGVYKTVDGGINWTPASNPNSNMCYKRCTYVIDEFDYFVGGAGCFYSASIERFTDPDWDVSTVNYQSFNTSEQVVDIDFNNGVGIAAIRGEYFLRSIDGGAFWDSIPSGLMSPSYLTSVMFVSADTVYAGLSDNGTGGVSSFLISTDTGLTWSQVNLGNFIYPAFQALGKSNNGDVYLGGKVNWNNQGALFKISNGVAGNIELVDHPINGIASHGQDITFAVGDSGYVVVNTNLTSLGLNDEDYFYPINIYPNPTSDFMTVENEFNKNVVYNLVDLNGKVLVADIVATNGTIIDISRLETGIYYLKPTENQFNTVHKIMKL